MGLAPRQQPSVLQWLCIFPNLLSKFPHLHRPDAMRVYMHTWVFLKHPSGQQVLQTTGRYCAQDSTLGQCDWKFCMLNSKMCGSCQDKTLVYKN
eukprot:354166-Rhodomonas_salina.4